MIWALLDALAHPKDWAVSIRNGEFYLEPIADVRARNLKVRG
jgi:hypothetical protein